MTTPSLRPRAEAATPAGAPAPSARPPLVRPRDGRVVAGVAAGLSAHLGVPVRVVRIGVLALLLAGGAGAALYLFLWAFVPADGADVPRAPGASPTGAGTGPATLGEAVATVHAPWRAVPRDAVLGLALLLVGLYALAVRQGWPVRPQVVVPVVVVGAGVVLAFSQLDAVDRARLAERTGVRTRAALLRVAGGVVLVVVGVLLGVLQGADFTGPLGTSVLSAVAVLGGVGLVLAPWGVRLWRDLDAERTARIREAARADVAAHLHDSVLQTLALIQRRSDDAGEVARLARAQERDLRAWLYGAPPSQARTLAAAVAEVAADAEDLHGAVVEVVTVGDVPVDDRTGALVAALREAVANAARHAGGRVDVYVEAGPDGVEAFVRDRGPGFDPAAVPAHRSGLRESVVGRMERHGGSARVLTTPGEGTEIRLALPPEVTA